jgi:hypothetical protein
VVGNFINDFRVNNDRAIYDQIGNILPDFGPFVDYAETSLLLTRHSAQTQLNHQGVLIRLFMESVSELVQHLQGGVYHRIDFGTQDKLAHLDLVN